MADRDQAAAMGRPLPTAGGETEVASSMPATGTASAAQDQSYTRQAVIEYRGQIVKVLILRSFWRFRRVMMAVKGEQYRLTWIRAKRIWFYEQIEPELWNNRKVWS